MFGGTTPVRFFPVLGEDRAETLVSSA